MPPQSDAIKELISLGIAKQKAQFALRESDGDVEAAADWCLGAGLDWTPQSLLQTSYPAPPAEQQSTSRFEDVRHDSQFARPVEILSTTRSSAVKVPTARYLSPGVKVRIILKQDQSSGRTVDGTIQELLTKGDHPRGVKVRLVDGRVGRVQQICI